MGMQGSTLPDESSHRSRVACKTCGVVVELPRLREHLRSEHQADTTTVETQYLSARIEARRSQRARAP